MIIKKSRIQRLAPYLTHVPDGVEFALGARLSPEASSQLSSLGFSPMWVEGETLLPPAEGPIARRNAEGWDIVHKDRPKETAYREFEWTWEEFHGPYDRVEQSRIIYQPYERYQRTSVPPPSLELSTVTTPQGRMAVVSREFDRDGAEENLPLLATNLLLEIFGEAEILTGDLRAFVTATVRRVNWEVLPVGKHPWTSLAPKVEGVLGVYGERKRPVFEHRWRTISSYQPDFVAVGRAGFAGYLIFGFSDRELFILESAYYGNATYVLDREWETLSTLTKAELIHESLHKDRIIHREDWDHRMRSLLGQAGPGTPQPGTKQRPRRPLAA